MPLLEHLIELRRRLVYSAIAIAVGFVICYSFSKEIYAFLTHPLAVALEGHGEHKMIYTNPTEAFFTYLKLAFWGGFCLAFPVVGAQLWMFVAPGLYRNERKAFLPFLCATPVLFIMGAALAYFVVIPFAWKFFISFETAASPGQLPIELEAR